MNIVLENIDYIYNQGSNAEKKALDNVSVQFDEPQFIALVGSTGSGKSTLVQLLNGLKKPSRGRILIDGKVISDDKKALRDLRCRVGLVFQYPEYQLFDETVLQDVAFGPKNKGLSNEEAMSKSKKAIIEVGLSKEHYDKSPFDLSGGEKRRAAIAGILAMDPEVLILDEPTAGLDPKGKDLILDLVKKYQQTSKVIVIMITHNMDEAAEYADRIIVMDSGRIAADGEPHEVFADNDIIEHAGLAIPQAAELLMSMGIKGKITISEAVDSILAIKQDNNKQCLET